jgi:hypothetical protein
MCRLGPGHHNTEHQPPPHSRALYIALQATAIPHNHLVKVDKLLFCIFRELQTYASP